MKRALFSLLALAFCLSACTPAASPTQESEAAAVAEETTETAQEETNAAQTAALSAESLRGDGYLGESDTAWYQMEHELQADGTLKMQVVKLDYATARKSVLCTIEEPATQVGDAMLRGDTVYAFVDQTMYKIPANGGEAQAVPLEQKFYPTAADEVNAYNFTYDSGSNNFVGLRLDLATGQITDLQMPAQTWEVWAVGEDRFLLCRLLTETPLPNAEEAEMYAAAIQNAVCEYDWYDPATGELEKILEEPYYGAEQPDGTKRMHRFLGLRDGRLYFSWTVPGEDGTALDAGAESCTLQGQDWQAVPGWPQGQEALYSRLQNNRLRWAVGTGGWNFDLETGTAYTVEERADTSFLAFAGDDRVLVQVFNTDDQGNYQVSYALADAQAYLNGTAELTPIEDASTEG